LVGYKETRQRREQQAALVASAADAVRLTRIRYSGGNTSYLEVLTTDTDLYDAQLQLAQSQRRRRPRWCSCTPRWAGVGNSGCRLFLGRIGHGHVAVRSGIDHGVKSRRAQRVPPRRRKIVSDGVTFRLSTAILGPQHNRSTNIEVLHDLGTDESRLGVASLPLERRPYRGIQAANYAQVPAVLN
jgi:Outer membrane efflux protein